MLDSTLLPDATSAHLLLVDDDPEQLRLLVEFLRGTSYKLSLAFNGAQGYDRAVAVKPDLVVLDVRMPGTDGLALCRKLKANAATADIPVIFLSSASEVKKKLSAFEGGAVDYIVKPYVPEEVVARIGIHLQLSGKLRPIETRDNEPADEDGVITLAAQRELHRHLAMTPQLLAARLGVSARRLTRAFRNTTGMTPFEYVREERMKNAQRLLVESELSIVAISQELGFSTAANFSTAFRQYTGLAPSDYRRSMQPDTLKHD